MNDFLAQHHLAGVVIGAATLLIIGLFHPIVIKAEYRFGTRCWWFFLACGVAGITGSLFVKGVVASALLGVFGVTCLWSIREVFEQRRRVARGWFPRNPERK